MVLTATSEGFFSSSIARGNIILTTKRPKPNGFNIDAYKQRLRLLREIIAGANQTEFAERLGIEFKRWSNYERGYPVPRETAFLLMEKFPGISVEWIWFGMTGNLSTYYRDKIDLAMKLDNERLRDEAALEKAKQKLRDASEKRQKALQPPTRARR